MQRETVVTILRMVLHRYEWIHLTLGFVGNTCFVVGSVLFLWESTKPAGVWLFIVGATGMWLGSTGSAIATYERHEQDHGGGRRDGTAERGRRAPAEVSRAPR
jgi:hypothetical protein